MRYIAELEHKVQTLQTETTTLSTQFTKLQVAIICDKLTFALLLSLVYYLPLCLLFLFLCVLACLQRDNSDLKSENNECKLRLQAMEQQSLLKDGLYTFLCYFMHQLAQTCFNFFIL